MNSIYTWVSFKHTVYRKWKQNTEYRFVSNYYTNNEYFHSCMVKNIFMGWNMEYSIPCMHACTRQQLIECNGKLHLSPNENFFYHCTNKTIHYLQVLFDTTMDQCIEWITEPFATQMHMDAAELHLWRSKLILHVIQKTNSKKCFNEINILLIY